MLGIITMRLVAGLFVQLLERYPTLEDSAYALVGWISIKLLVESYESWRHPGETVHLLPAWFFWAGIAAIAALGTTIALRSKPRSGLSARFEP
jgi:predicted tellurium resistance membrane protein TerC